jgi:hypothetical protein
MFGISSHSTQQDPDIFTPQIKRQPPQALLQWTQNNCELRWPLQVDTWEAGEDRKAIAHERENTIISLYYTMWNNYVQAAEVSQRRTAVSSKCFQLYYTCSDRLLTIALPSCSFHLSPLLLWRFPSSRLFCVQYILSCRRGFRTLTTLWGGRQTKLCGLVTPPPLLSFLESSLKHVLQKRMSKVGTHFSPEVLKLYLGPYIFYIYIRYIYMYIYTHVCVCVCV